MSKTDNHSKFDFPFLDFNKNRQQIISFVITLFIIKTKSKI